MSVAALAPRAAHAASCGDLLIILDRSGSMNTCSIQGKTKENIAKDALRKVLSDFGSMPMGLMVFPDTLRSCSGGASCATGRVVIDIAAEGAQKISSFLDTMPTSCGGTPSGNTMLVAREYAGWLPGKKHHVLLLTDGQPTCQDDHEGTCDGGGSRECLNPTKVFSSIEALHMKGIDTFVVGFEGMGTVMGAPFPTAACAMPFNPATLDRAADLGGQANPTSPKYLSAVDEATLLEALRRIGNRVFTATVGGCASGPENPPGGGGGAAGTDGGGQAGAGGAGGGGQGGGGDQGGVTPPGGSAGQGRGSPGGCACRSAGGGTGGLAALGLALAFFGAARRLVFPRHGQRPRSTEPHRLAGR